VDTTRDITYRGFTLNDADIQESIVGGGGDGSGIAGCVVDSVQWTDVDVVQWLEKRSQGDGSDAGDVFQGVRRVRMAGTLFAKTKLELWDDLWDLRAALNPVLAQREEPLDRGYRPLYFSVPTNRAADYPSGVIDLQMKALPRGISHDHGRDASGGLDIQPLSIPWQATFVCKDPGIYAQAAVDVAFDSNPTPVTDATGQNTGDTITKTSHGLVNGDRITIYAGTGGTGLTGGVTYYVVNKTDNTFQVSLTAGGAAVPITLDYSNLKYVKSVTYSGTWNNRGNYLGKLEALIVVGEGAGTISATVGDSVFTVTVPASTGERTIRIKADKTITFEEDDVEDLYMGRITFSGDSEWPLIDPGETPYSVTFHGMAGLGTGGHMWFYEQYA
jgi:hypothetical protein